MNIRDYIENRRLDDLVHHETAARMLADGAMSSVGVQVITKAVEADIDLADIFVDFDLRAPGLADLSRFITRVSFAEIGDNLSFVRDGESRPLISLYHPVYNAAYHAEHGLTVDPDILTVDDFMAAVAEYEAGLEDDRPGM